MSTLTRDRAKEITAGFEGKRIIVLGDLMLDEFIWGKVRRISPEAPVPVVEVEKQTVALGGAGNVTSNIVALGAIPIPIGVVGEDSDGLRLREAFNSLDVPTEGIIIDPDRPTTLKSRIIAHNQQVVRTDRESRKEISQNIEEKIVAIFEREMKTANALLVSDYSKGLLSAGILSRTLNAARARGLAVCLDPKNKSFEHYQPVTIITPNHQEAAEAAGVMVDNTDGVISAGHRIMEFLDCEAVLITRGEEGMTLFTLDGGVSHIPTVAREVYDVTGAGDTVIATLTLALTAGGSFLECAILANHAAGVVVGKVGTATSTREELINTIE